MPFWVTLRNHHRGIKPSPPREDALWFCRTVTLSETKRSRELGTGADSPQIRSALGCTVAGMP